MPRRRQRATRKRGFKYFLRRQGKKEHHRDVVHPEMQRVRCGVVTLQIKVRPDDSCGGPGEKQERVVEDELENAMKRRLTEPCAQHHLLVTKRMAARPSVCLQRKPLHP
jgi:hypothetical protein